MPQLKILNSKEIKEILSSIEKQYDTRIKLDYAFLKNSRNKVFIINKDISEIDLSKLRVNSIGMYFCELNNEIRLSIEGSQLIGPKAKKNIMELTEAQAKQWMNGQDLEIKEQYNGFVIVKNKNYYLGCGKFKDNKILNYVGKERRVSAI